MSSYRLPARDVPLDDSWDVIVVGGGPAGCAAATAAAREGARTLLIEATGCLGGMGTSALVPFWCPFSDQEKIIYRGIAERVLAATKAGMPHVDKEMRDWVPIDAELLKRIYDDLVTEAGAQVLFNSGLATVETDDEHRVTAILVNNKAGLSAYRAAVYVDCTGDGDLATWAGAEFAQGEDGSGELQPATHCFILSNVDDFAYQCNPPFFYSPGMTALMAEKKYPIIDDKHNCNALVGPSTVCFNAGHLWQIESGDPFCVSKALMHGRKIAAAYRDALAEYMPSVYGNAFLVATGSLLGVRESRRIIGDYLLTLNDYLARRSFSDEICRNCFYIDVHSAADSALGDADYNFDEQVKAYEPGESHGIPYRCLTPRGLRNVLVAGRSISCDRPTQGSIRAMPACLATGEAAGLAAALAAQQSGQDVHAVDTQHLRRRLLEEGAYLPEIPATVTE